MFFAKYEKCRMTVIKKYNFYYADKIVVSNIAKEILKWKERTKIDELIVLR